MSLLLLLIVGLLGKRVGWASWLPALPLALWPWLQARSLLWWWPAVLWLIANCGPGLANRFPTLPRFPDSEPSPRWGLASVLLGVLALCALPPTQQLFVGRSLERTISPGTPWQVGLELAATPEEQGRYLPELRTALREMYPQGQFTGAIFASETQGEFFTWALPAQAPIALNTHAHLFPPTYWNACLNAKFAEPGWQEFLQNQQVNLIVVETNSHEDLVAALLKDPAWRIIVYEPADELPGQPAIRKLVALRLMR